MLDEQQIGRPGQTAVKILVKDKEPSAELVSRET